MIKQPGQSDDWLAISELITFNIRGLEKTFSQQLPGELRNDLAKLLAVGDKLTLYCHESRQQPPVDERRHWHELRNLAGTIQGYCELIQEEYGEHIRHQELQNIHHQCRTLLTQKTSEIRSPQTIKSSDRAIRPASLLIVDDRIESRDIVIRYLSNQYHQVFEAESGNQMFAVLELQKIDVILLDLVLEEMDGYELLTRLKTNPRWRSIPVIVISGSQDQERIVRCIEAGAEDYQFKPFNPALLQARINACLERKHWHDREQHYRDELEKNQRLVRTIFGRYLSQEIVSSLLENPSGLELGGEQRTVTVMMADINSFTTICEQLSPPRVVKLLNNYLGTMSDIIMAHNGTVDEFIGDAILAIFGAPVSREDDCDRAVMCALAMREAIHEVNRQNRLEDLPEIGMSIALHTGSVVAGNIGSQKRTKYGVVGHAVNQTARIEEACPKQTILISQAVIDHARNQLEICNGQNIKAKGIHSAISVFELVGFTEQQDLGHQ